MYAAVEQSAGGALADVLHPCTVVELMEEVAGSLDDVRRRRKFSPLLEQEGHADGFTLVAKVAQPIGMHRPRVGAAFAADDHPIQLFKRIGAVCASCT